MAAQATIWLDGSPSSTLPLPDRGLDYGDGLFETLLLRHGKPLFLDEHLKRLARGLQALGFPDCMAPIESQLLEVIACSGAKNVNWSGLRLTVTRGPGPRGYTPPESPQPRTLIQVFEIDRDCSLINEPANTAVATLRLASQPALAGIKHLNRLEQVLAAAEARQLGVDEMVLLDQSGHVNSVSAGNIFALKEGVLHTPPLEASGVWGTRRTLIIERWAPRAGLAVKEATLSLDDLHSAQALFYSSSLQGLRPICRLGTSAWHQHELCEALFRQYLQDVG